jgi:EF hand
MEESSKAAVNILLMMTKDDERTLDYEKFSQLILSIVSATGITFNEAADAMTLSMLQDKTISEEDLINLMVSEAVYSEVVALIEEETEAMEILDALQLGRLQKLFDLWDEDADGQISFEELVNGMRKFQGQMEVEESVQRASLLIIGFDEDQSQSLNKIEFAKAMVKYASAAGLPLEDLVDFMCVVSVMEENSPQEKAFFHNIAPEATAAIKQIESEMALLGIE